ncbi:MAG: GMP synthase [Saprospiraceae bacterium]|nr:GMP synthase [Saprospiraceae bacterium]
MSIKLAILDLNDNTPNLGLGSIVEHAKAFQSELCYQVFDVRHKHEIPGLDFDLYISSGGPGDPREGDGKWEVAYFDWISKVLHHNLNHKDKKYVLFICHSFQMASIYFKYGEIRQRNKKSFGTYPCYLTGNGLYEKVFHGLPNPMYVADFRSFEVIKENYETRTKDYPRVLAIEQIDPTEPRQRAIMAVRFTPEMIGTQFHPEAYAEGMYDYFNQENRRQSVIAEHGEDRLLQMIRDLAHPGKITLTNQTILPNFISESIKQIKEQRVPQPSFC